MDAAHRARTGISGLLSLLVVACSGGSPSAPALPTPLALFAETADIAFYTEPGDRVETEWQQQAHDWLEATIGVSLPVRMKYYKYTSTGSMFAHTGSRGNAWADPDPANPAIHTIWPRDSHETVHVLSARIGRPSDFFNEGLAVAHQMDPVAGDMTALWSGVPIHTLARQYLGRQQLPPLAEWVESDPFRAHEDDMSYPCSGSFVRYLVDTHGMSAMRSFFQGASRDQDLATIRARFRSAFGFSLGEEEERWHRFLGG